MAIRASAYDWEKKARASYALACAALGLEPGSNHRAHFAGVPRAVVGDPFEACRAIVASNASLFGARMKNPAITIASAGDLQRAQREYRKTHWGLSGEKKTRLLRTGNPEAGTLVALGDLVEIVYRTRKLGDAGQREYEHKFARTLPVLAYHDDRLLICGGSYRIEWRGIVG